MLRLFLLFILICGVACTSSDDSGDEPYSVTDNPLATHFSEIYTDDLDGLLKRHYIRVLTTYSKTGYYLSDGVPAGHEYTLLKAYEKKLNKGVSRKKLKTVIEFIPCPRDLLIPWLISGKGDIVAAAMTITPERMANADFTSPYLTGINEVLITNKNDKGVYQSPEDLSGKQVYVRKSSSYYASLTALNKTLMQLRKRPVVIIPADESLETEDILEIVNSGVKTITLCDSHIAQRWQAEFPDLVIHDTVVFRENLEIAWLIRKNSPDLKSSLNRFVRKHKKGTRLGNIYFDRYFNSEASAPPPFKWENHTLVNEYLVHIRKYAEKYDIDPTIIMAVAFCESGFDNSKRNPSGATGIMQVRPETARDKNIGIPDISSPENNIHAGVKYIAFLRNRYFNSDTMSEKNKIRFSVAAYNAGPAKITRVRKLASDMGFDVDKWFRNVEYAALKTIGRETVNYVSSVNKYSIMYSLAEETLENRARVKNELLK